MQRLCQRKNCVQTLEITVPFAIESLYEGYISVVTFSEAAKQHYLARKQQVVEFLQTMMNLMVSAGKEHVSRLRAEQNTFELNTILQHMDSIVIACDADGRIMHSNKAFATLLGRDAPVHNLRLLDLLESNEISHVFETNEALENQETDIVINGAIHRRIVSARVWKSDARELAEYLFMIHSLDDIRRYIASSSPLPEDEVLMQIVGNSPEIKELRGTIKQFANSISTVLIKGETGTGKELVARALHNLSARRDKPYVTINCSAIPDTLLESELFGYEQGAFTGANRGGKIGLFEIGNGGTIFLDEIGDMPIHLQAKLLRVLQEKKITRLGGHRPIHLDVRIIAATNQPLESMVQNKKFRSDLFYRLNILPINTPALRHIPSDIDALVFHFIAKHNKNLEKSITGIENSAAELLRRYPWPGNVRELENTIEYAVNLEKGTLLTKESLPPEIIVQRESGASLKSQIREHERAIIAHALEKHEHEKNAINKAAAELDISRASLYQKIKDYHLMI